ncbi:MAG: hypothetical protein O6933_06500 [Planctomycetota bacterium]|nr:hypothetical protein [Planctomycetota bacterium]
MRSFKIVFVIGGLGLAGVSLVQCGEDQPDDAGAPSSPLPSVTVDDQPARAGWTPSDDPKTARFLGLVAPKPVTWIEHPPSSNMRVANYTVPGRDGSEAAHVVVSYFGRDQGGTVDRNLLRWQSQFKPDADGTPQQPTVHRFEVDGMRVTLVELTGEWQKMGAQWYTPDQLFLSAIVEAPMGKVFIRFAGQTATVQANRDAFMAMIRGLRRADES